MDELLRLKGELTALDAQIDELLGNDDLNDQQRADHDELQARREKLMAAIAREKDKLARAAERAEIDADAAQIDERAKRLATPGANRLTTPDRPSPQDVPAERTERETARSGRIFAECRRYGAVKNFRGERHTSGGRYSAEERAFRFGMWAMAALSRDLPHRFGHLAGAQDWVRANMAAVGSTDASGYHNLIHPEFSMDIIDLREQFGVARRLLRYEPMASDTKTIHRRTGGLTAYAMGENAAITESNKTWNEVTLTAKKWGVISRASKEVNMDLAISWGDDLAGEIAYAFASAEDDAAFNGDGSSTYHGMRGIRTRLQDCDGAGTDSAGLVTGTGNAYSELVLADFDAVVGKLPQYADRPEASWVCHRTFYYTVIEKLVQASGGVPAYEVRQGERRPRPIFKGYPVDFSQKFPSTEANSQVCITLGAYGLGAAFGDRQQDSIEFSDQAYVNGQSLWERDQIGIKGTERYDIVVHDVGTSSTPGPIVGLQTASS